MKIGNVLIILVLAAFLAASCSTGSKQVALNTETDTASYFIGISIGKSLKEQSHLESLNSAAIKKAIDDNRLSKDQLKAAVNGLIEKCRIYSGGCLKRGRASEAAYYADLADAYRELL